MDSLAHIPVWAKEFHHSACLKEIDLENDDLHITSLPPELMISIFRFLDASSIDRCGAVCKYWFLLSREVCRVILLNNSVFFFFVKIIIE